MDTLADIANKINETAKTVREISKVLTYKLLGNIISAIQSEQTSSHSEVSRVDVQVVKIPDIESTPAVVTRNG
ncbi:hypothetical protein NPIL_84381 [Nephila pilipes]|uniref:Uncharacterized protein n=1 Tax=Nephila pilipes TaxID=299642 RepID=A0A8X6UU51_NEPPI|nr:hypothetical protein NPIL_84381 [Nephila pilipes]